MDDFTSQIPAFSDEDYDRVLELETARRVLLKDQAKKNESLQNLLRNECAKNPFFFFSNFVWIYDVNRQAVIPYMLLEHHKKLQQVYLGLSGYRMPSGRLYNAGVLASRATGKTAAIVAAAYWDWAFGTTHRQVFVAHRVPLADNGTRNFEAGTVDKVRFMIDHTPKWLLPRQWACEKTRAFDKVGKLINDETNSIIEVVSSKPNTLRGTRARRVYFDEADSIENFKKLMTAASKQGPWIMTSTSTGPNTTFARYIRNKIKGVETKKVAELKKGEVVGMVRLDFSYRQMPDYNPNTEKGRARIEEEKTGMDPITWAQEMENDFFASMPARIWGGVFRSEEHILSRKVYLEEIVPLLGRAKIFDGWDFGDNVLTSWVRAAWFGRDHLIPSDLENVLILLKYKSWGANVDVREVANHVLAHNVEPFVPKYICGDRAGNQRHTYRKGGRMDTGAKSWIQNLQSCGIKVKGEGLDWRMAIRAIRHALKDSRIFLAPDCDLNHNDGTPTLTEVFEGYRWAGDEESETVVAGGATPLKNPLSHPADAIQHIAAKTLMPFYRLESKSRRQR